MGTLVSGLTDLLAGSYLGICTVARSLRTLGPLLSLQLVIEECYAKLRSKRYLVAEAGRSSAVTAKQAKHWRVGSEIQGLARRRL